MLWVVYKLENTFKNMKSPLAQGAFLCYNRMRVTKKHVCRYPAGASLTRKWLESCSSAVETCGSIQPNGGKKHERYFYEAVT